MDVRLTGIRFGSLLLFAAAVPSAQGVRLNGNAFESEKVTEEKITNSSNSGNLYDVSHPVHILLTRHGLSCANVVGTWAPTWFGKKTHAFMRDPLLCKAGERFSEAAHDQVPPVLEELSLPQPDAVLSSVLARAVHTAALQYQGRPTFVVPYIRESGLGEDNKYNDVQTQVKKLQEELGRTSWSVDYQYANSLGFDHSGDWDMFRHFLTNTFLPDLVRKLKKPAGEPIVLAVVSHSFFMNEGEVYDKCHMHYVANPGSTVKAQNNQVVKLSYEFREHRSSSSDVDVTPVRTLTDDGTACMNIIDGVSYKDKTGNAVRLCKSDVGDTCWSSISALSMSKYPSILEDEIVALQKELGKLEFKGSARRSVARSKALTQKIEELSNTPCWSGGLPQVDRELSTLIQVGQH